MPKTTGTKATTLLKKAKDATADLQDEARAALADIRTLLAQLARNFWDLGRALKTFRDRKLHVALGYSAFAAMLESERLLSDSQAYKLIGVVENLRKREAVRLGFEKAAALVAYAAATPDSDSAAELAKSDALIGDKRVSKSSVRDLEERGRHVRAKAAAGKPRSPAQAAKDKADAALVKRVKAQIAAAGFGRATVTLTATKVVVELARSPFET